jgi:hypothetical protein
MQLPVARMSYIYKYKSIIYDVYQESYEFALSRKRALIWMMFQYCSTGTLGCEALELLGHRRHPIRRTGIVRAIVPDLCDANPRELPGQ